MRVRKGEILLGSKGKYHGRSTRRRRGSTGQMSKDHCHHDLQAGKELLPDDVGGRKWERNSERRTNAITVGKGVD